MILLAYIQYLNLASILSKIFLRFLLQPAQTLRNSDSVRRCDGIFKRRVQTKNEIEAYYNT